MAGERLYPYAIVEASLAPPSDLAGLRGAPVALVTGGALGAWASALPPFEPRREDLVVHHRIVERAGEAGAALPVRFGTSFADPEALAAALRRREPALTESLARVGRRRELAVTLEWTDPPEAESPAPAPAEADSGPGRRFLAERARRWAAAETRRERAQNLSALLHAALAAAGVVDADLKERIVPAPRIALSCAVLTDPSRAKELARRVREVTEGWDDVRLHLAGPWPPYSFSDTE